MQGVSVSASVNTLMAISIERCIAISCPYVSISPRFVTISYRILDGSLQFITNDKFIIFPFPGNIERPLLSSGWLHCQSICHGFLCFESSHWSMAAIEKYEPTKALLTDNVSRKKRSLFSRITFKII